MLARVRCEFGCKISVATSMDGGFVVGMRAMPGNPYDGHTLDDGPGTGRNAHRPAPRPCRRRPRLPRPRCPRHPGADLGHAPRPDQGAEGAVATAKRDRPEIGHMKTDGRLARCPLKGTSGDAIFAVLCGCWHNIRKILATGLLGPVHRMDRRRREAVNRGRWRAAQPGSGRIGVVHGRRPTPTHGRRLR